MQRKQMSYEQLVAECERLNAEIERMKRLPVPAPEQLGGIEMALKGLTKEIEGQLEGRPTIGTFQTIQQLCGLAQEVVWFRTLLRDVTMEDFEDEDIDPDDPNMGYCGPNFAYGNGRFGVQQRARRRVRRVAREQNPVVVPGRHVNFAAGPGVAGPVGPNHEHPQGFGRRNGLGAPYNAWAGDVRDAPGNPLAGVAGLFNGLIEVMEGQNAKTDERAAKRARYQQYKNVSDLLRTLKRERAALIRDKGDEDTNEELVKLNERVDKLQKKRDELLDQITEDEPDDQVEDVTAPKTVEDYLREVPGNHVCTNPECDQVQNSRWHTADGTPMDCDICGAPMQRVPPDEDEEDCPEHHEPATVEEAV